MKFKCRIFYSSIVLFSCLAYLPAAEKPTCAVLTFDAKAGMNKDETEFLTERFAIEFGKLEKYQLISRSKMKEVFELQKFARSDNCSATECAIEAGKLLSAQFMVYGSIGKIGNTYSVNVALVSVESGAITSQGSVDVEGKVDDLLKMGMLNAARQLVGLGALASIPTARAEAPAEKPAAGAVQSVSEAIPDQPKTEEPLMDNRDYDWLASDLSQKLLRTNFSRRYVVVTGPVTIVQKGISFVVDRKRIQDGIVCAFDRSDRMSISIAIDASNIGPINKESIEVLKRQIIDLPPQITKPDAILVGRVSCLFTPQAEGKGSRLDIECFWELIEIETGTVIALATGTISKRLDVQPITSRVVLEE